MWQQNPDSQRFGNIKVYKGDKVKKGFGSSYVSYTVSSEGQGGCLVKRGLRHFEWLHARLTDKYSCICVPPLPDKSFNKRYGEDFDTKMPIKLARWLQRVEMHPVLGKDVLAFRLFMTVRNYGKTEMWHCISIC